MNFGSLNIRSLANKVDHLLELRFDHNIDVLFLVETWHDADSVCLRRLRADGFRVIDCPRPRTTINSLSTNHGGVAVVATSSVRLTPVNLGSKPTTFEIQCVRVASGSAACVAAVIYRPGSVAVTDQFFVDLSDVLERLATFVEPVLLVGDVNIRLDRPDDSHTIQFTDALSACGLANFVKTATHDQGGTLDIVAARVDLVPPAVDVLDVGLSDHRLLRWRAPLVRPDLTYTTTTSRPWAQLTPARLRAALQSSLLCRPEAWSDLDVDGMARLYNTELSAVLDRMVPLRVTTCRRRTSDPWFDDDCRVAKRSVRLFERVVRRAKRAVPFNPSVVNAATTVWHTRRREYRKFLDQKRESFWRSKIDSQRSMPRQLWRSVDTLMGRGRVPTSASTSADHMHQFFDDKVAGVRASTDNAPPPTYTTAPPDCRLSDFQRLTIDDVTAAVRALPDKQCESDPLPTRLLKDHVDLLAPLLVEL